jgi:hypothetical protein
MKKYSTIISLAKNSSSPRTIADNFDGDLTETTGPNTTTLRGRIESTLDKAALEAAIRALAPDATRIILAEAR